MAISVLRPAPSSTAPRYRSGMRRFRAGQAAAEHAPGTAVGGRQRVLLCHHDVQRSPAGRDYRARGGSGSCDRRAGPVGIHALGVDRVADPGGVFWRRRNHHLRRELFQHGDCRVAGRRISSTAQWRAEQRSRHRAGLWRLGWQAMPPSTVSALLTACELGIQPLFFKDASGAPLYAPYALHIAIPAMMLGHLTFAGLAELFVSGGVVAYLQRTNPALLGQKSCGWRQEGCRLPAEASGWRMTRPLWIRLALLMLLTPLGILAAGTAWGEWGAKDFSDPQMRQQIAAASGQVAPPSEQPRGLARLSSLWSAPFPQYAPPFVRHPAFGYVMSAMFGCGLILGFFLLWAG